MGVSVLGVPVPDWAALLVDALVLYGVVMVMARMLK